MAVPLLRLIRYEERMECINTWKNIRLGKSGDVVFRGMYGGIVLFGKELCTPLEATCPILIVPIFGNLPP